MRGLIYIFAVLGVGALLYMLLTTDVYQASIQLMQNTTEVGNIVP